MTQLAWDQVGERRFETGVDRGVLYLPDGGGIAWSGLTGVDENSEDTSTPFYLDGIKYLNAESIGDFKAVLKALTYPDEFEPFIGIGSFGDGLMIGEQPTKRFGLSYRTRIGDDLSGIDAGYKIHILYNVSATPSVNNYQSLGAQIAPLEFSWALSTSPMIVSGHRPTAHIVIDSTKLDLDILGGLESILYGTDSTDPSLPTLAEFLDLLETWQSITITDNGDGTWTASSIGPDDLIVMLDDTTFQINKADATYLDEDTYEISTTIPDY